MRDLSFLTLLILKIQFFWKEYPRHHRSGVLEHVSPCFSHPSRTSQPFKMKAWYSFDMSIINNPPSQRNNPETLNPILVSVELLSTICCFALQRRSWKVLYKYISCDYETFYVLGNKNCNLAGSVVDRNELHTAQQILRNCQHLNYARN